MRNNRILRILLSYRDTLDRMLQYPLQIILGLTAVTLFFAWQIPYLTIATSIHDLVIEDLPETGQYEKFMQQFGSNEIIRVVVKSDDVFQETTFRRIELLSEAAAAIQGVRRVVSLPGIRKSIDLTDRWSLAEFSRIIKGAELFRKNLVSEDGKTTVLTLVLKADADQEQVIRDVERIIVRADKSLTLYQIGMPLVSSALAAFTQKDFYRLPFITFLLISVILFALYRRIGYFFLPILCVAVSLTWTFGLMAIVGIPLSMLTMIVPVFLIAVGTAYCLHIVSEYLVVSRTMQDREEIVRQTFSAVTFPTTLAAFTTAIGLGSLLVNRISAIQEFSIVACLGIFSFVLILLTLLPSVMIFLPVPITQKTGADKTSRRIDRLIEWIIDLNLHRQKIVFPIIGIVAAIGIAGIFQLQVETNPMGYFRENTAISRNFHDIYRDLSGSFPLNVVMKSRTEDYFEDPNHVAAIEQLQTFLQTLPGVDKTISFADYMKLVNYATNRFEKENYILPTESYEVRMLINSYKTMLGRDLLTAFMSDDFSRAHILLFTHISSSRQFLDTREKIREYVRKHFSKDLDWEITGFGIVISASSHHLTWGQVKSLSLTLIMVFGIMFFLFLSLKVGLITLVPNIFPIIVNFGVMGWFGIELSMATSLIASIAIGLAVDDTIHYLVRYNHEFRKDLDDKRALKETIRHIGRPIIFTTLTISIGFSVLMFSSFKPTAVFGLLMMITMLSALVGDLIILPALILHVDLVTVWDLVRLKMGMEPRFGIPLFSGLSRIQVYYILMAGSLKTINAGDVLFRKADHSDSMYAVISGRLDVYDHKVAQTDDGGADHGMRKLLTRLQKGDIVGEMGLVRSAPRSATVIAAEPSELLYVNWKMIERLHWLSPNAAWKFNTNLMAILCDRMDRMTHELYESSLVDDLTGLINRKGFVKALEMETQRLRRYGTHFVLCLFTVIFKPDAGALKADDRNRIIQEVSRKIFRETRKSNILARISYDTFALMIPHDSSAGSRQALGRMESLLNGHPASERQPEIRTVFSLSDKIADADRSGLSFFESLESGISERL